MLCRSSASAALRWTEDTAGSTGSVATGSGHGGRADLGPGCGGAHPPRPYAPRSCRRLPLRTGLPFGISSGPLRLQAAQTLAALIGAGIPRRYTHEKVQPSSEPDRTVTPGTNILTGCRVASTHECCIQVRPMQAYSRRWTLQTDVWNGWTGEGRRNRVGIVVQTGSMVLSQPPHGPSSPTTASAPTSRGSPASAWTPSAPRSSCTLDLCAPRSLPSSKT